MPDDLDAILQQVASGDLSPEMAEQLIDALHRHHHPKGSAPGAPPPPADAHAERTRRVVRLQVTEGGRSVVNLQVPMTWAALAGSVLPGLSNENADRLRDAIRSGTVGRILEIQDEDGDGVIISTE
jgi:hypothetical protein